jgi:prophage regulatory protein
MLTTRAGEPIEGGSGNTGRFLRREQVQELTGLSTSTLYEQMQRGDFPRGFHITPRRVAWLETDVHRWMADKLAAAGRDAKGGDHVDAP